MNKQLCLLLQQKVKIYEKIINGIKITDFSTLVKFEKEFQELETLDKKININNGVNIKTLMEIKL